MAEQKVVLGYWGIRGRGNVSRLLLEYCGVPYEEKRYSDPNEWFGKDSPELAKSGFLFPNLPYLTDGNFKLSESIAIEEYIVRRGGKPELMGKNIQEEAVVQMLNGVIRDQWKAVVELIMNPNFETEKAKHWTDGGKVFADMIIKHMGNKKFLVGDSPCYADFVLYETLSYYRGIFPDDFKGLAQLVSFMNNFESLPKIKEYQASARYMKAPFMPPHMAKWTGL